MRGPGDTEAGRGGEEPERGLSGMAAAYRQAEPYMAASSTLMASVAGFTALGYGLDRWIGDSGPWLLIAGAVVGIGVGFVGFFRQILLADARRRRTRKPEQAARPPPAAGGTARGPAEPRPAPPGEGPGR